MAKLQSQLQKFHKNIMFDFEEKSTLRDKRDKLLKKIEKSLSENNRPTSMLVNQGSYIYNVGIKPISDDQEYDIDVGIAFNIRSDEYKATDVRNWVYGAIKDHTKNVEEKGPCIRVRYEAGYHVDLVCYAKYRDNNMFERFQLAHKNGLWISSDPNKIKAHIKTVREKFKHIKYGSGSDQLQRVVRYLKRWNDLIFSKASNEKPIGLALLLYCAKVLQSPMHDSQGNPDDLQALIYITEKAKNSNRIRAGKPDTSEDVFRKISANGMKNLIEKFQELHKDLLKARNSDNLKESCKIMRKHFGYDFPLEENDTEKKKKLSLLSSASSLTFKPYGIIK